MSSKCSTSVLVWRVSSSLKCEIRDFYKIIVEHHLIPTVVMVKMDCQLDRLSQEISHVLEQVPRLGYWGRKMLPRCGQRHSVNCRPGWMEERLCLSVCWVWMECSQLPQPLDTPASPPSRWQYPQRMSPGKLFLKLLWSSILPQQCGK